MNTVFELDERREQFIRAWLPLKRRGESYNQWKYKVVISVP
jgi:hypothetical protein